MEKSKFLKLLFPFFGMLEYANFAGTKNSTKLNKKNYNLFKTQIEKAKFLKLLSTFFINVLIMRISPLRKIVQNLNKKTTTCSETQIEKAKFRKLLSTFFINVLIMRISPVRKNCTKP